MVDQGIKSIHVRLTRFDYAKLEEMRDAGFIKTPTGFCALAVEKALEKKYKEFQETIQESKTKLKVST